MFEDDQNQDPAGAAHNEPPDMFDGTDSGNAGMADLSPETTVDGPSALEAGKLQPAAPQPAPAPVADPLAGMHTMQSDVPQSSGALKKILIYTSIVAVIGVAATAAWWYGFRGKGFVVPGISSTTNTAQSPQPAAPAQADDTSEPAKGGIVDIDVSTPPVTSTSTPVATSTEFVQQQPAAPAQPQQPAQPATPVDTNQDTDKDGLTDVKEQQLGTDPHNADTDADGLTDGAEVNIWGTDPMKKDTDGDGFPDGQEVMNGFNPKGPGKLQ